MSVIPTHIPAQRTPRTAAPVRSATSANPTGGCPSCGSARLTVLKMTLTDGTPVQFASCHDCEHRHWSHEGEDLHFEDVIARATKLKA